jgi:general nucleoside transport system permease protein
MLASAINALSLPLLALLISAVLFGVFVSFAGANPFDVYSLIYTGAFGSWFSWQNTLTRAAPLLLTALCVALPARLGLVIIGAEGALVLGGLAATVTGLAFIDSSPVLTLIAMAFAGMVLGGLWICLSAALKLFRGVNETISSLLLSYIALAIFNQLVEGPLRDPSSLNKPSTYSIAETSRLGTLFGSDIHWGFGYGVVFCLLTGVLMLHTTFGFAAKVAGGNLRAAQLVGLPFARLVLISCFLGGAAAGLAGVVEVAAIHGNANASLIAGYGTTGILVAFLARQNPFAVIPVAILFGGIAASGGLLQRRADLPDATVLVLQGIVFAVLLASEALSGRLDFMKRFAWQSSPSETPATKPEVIRPEVTARKP